jgi:hypothetical protein
LIEGIDMVMRECAPAATDIAEQSTTTTSSLSSTPSPSSFCRTFDFGDDVTDDCASDLLYEQAQLTTPAQRAKLSSLTRALTAISASVNNYEFETLIPGLSVTPLLLLSVLSLLPMACRIPSATGRITRLPVWGEEEWTPGHIERICTIGRGRCVFTTRAGRVGLGPGAMAPGDSVAVFFGAPMGYVLRGGRWAASGRSWIGCTMIGQCFLDGIMDGELYWKVGEDGERVWGEEEFKERESTVFCVV